MPRWSLSASSLSARAHVGVAVDHVGCRDTIREIQIVKTIDGQGRTGNVDVNAPSPSGNAGLSISDCASQGVDVAFTVKVALVAGGAFFAIDHGSLQNKVSLHALAMQLWTSSKQCSTHLK
jgi:hypothetical protein